MKLVSETSKQAYKEIHQEGITTNQKKDIMIAVNEYYYVNGLGMSLREICALTNYEINAVSGRVNTLKKEGRVLEGTRRKCFITNRLITPVIAL